MFHSLILESAEKILVNILLKKKLLSFITKLTFIQFIPNQPETTERKFIKVLSIKV